MTYTSSFAWHTNHRSRPMSSLLLPLHVSSLLRHRSSEIPNYIWCPPSGMFSHTSLFLHMFYLLRLCLSASQPPDTQLSLLKHCVLYEDFPDFYRQTWLLHLLFPPFMGMHWPREMFGLWLSLYMFPSEVVAFSLWPEISTLRHNA